MYAVLSDISFFCLLFNVTRLSLCKSGEKRESSTHNFFRTRRKRIASVKPSPPAQRCTAEQRSHSASDGGRTFSTSSSHTLLWHVYQGSNGSCCVKTVLLIERHSGLKVIVVSQGLNFKSTDSLSALLNPLIQVRCTSENVESCPSSPSLRGASSILSQ